MIDRVLGILTLLAAAAVLWAALSLRTILLRIQHMLNGGCL